MDANQRPDKMNYEVGQIVQVAYQYKDHFHMMVGKIEKLPNGKTKDFSVRLAEASVFPHKKEDGSEVEVIQVPLRMLGKIIDTNSSADSLKFNATYIYPVGRLALIAHDDYKSGRTKGRIIGMSFESSQDNELSYYVVLKRRNEDFEEYTVDQNDERSGVFAKLYPKKHVIQVRSHNVIQTVGISETDRVNPDIYKRFYMQGLWSKMAAIGLVRRVIKTVRTVPDKDDGIWYAFTTDDHYLDCSSRLEGFDEHQLTLIKGFSRDTSERPEPGDVIMTIPLDNPKKKDNPPVGYIPVKDFPGLDVFNTFVLTHGQHKIFTGRSPMQIVAMCEKLTENGRESTPFSLLLQGYFHKNFRDAIVDAFKEEHLWFLA